MSLWSSRALLALVLSLLLSTAALTGASADSDVPRVDVSGAGSAAHETDFGLEWRIVFPSGVDERGWATYCTVDGGAEELCTAEDINQLTLPAGPHKITITPRHQEDGLTGTPYVWDFMVDVTPPAVLEHDDTLLARIGRDITVPAFFDDPESGIDTWYCWANNGNVIGTDRVVIPSPEGKDSQWQGLQCRAFNDLSMWTHSDLDLIWDGQRPFSHFTKSLPGLMTTPLTFRMGASDSETRDAGEALRYFAKYRIITPRMKWRPWRTPGHWVTTKAARGGEPGWNRSFRLSRVPVGHYVCVSVGARDAVGFRHTSRRVCSARAWDDRNLSRSSGWRETTPRGAYRRTALRTTGQGATLTLSRPSMTRAANILVRKCPRCGSIELLGPDKAKWGADNMRFSLRANRSRWARIPVAWGKRAYEGGFTIRVTSSGRPVEVDGLAVTPWTLRNAKAWADPDENYPAR